MSARSFIGLLLIVSLPSFFKAGEMRTWTSAGGRTAEGELVSKAEKTITLKLPNGAESEVEITTLSVEDQQHIKDWKPTEPKRPIYVPEDAVYFEGGWYKIILEKESWSKANEKAESMEGHLAWIKNEETQEFLTQLAENIRLWLGASDAEVEGLWKWTDGEKVKFKNWGKDQPFNWKNRQHYLCLDENGNWEDLWNLTPHIAGYIVQWDQ